MSAGGLPKFASAVASYANRRMAILPTGGPDGKQPLIRNWTAWKVPPSPSALFKWGERWPHANLGCNVEVSGFTVVDIDDPKQVDAILARCGGTPVLASTPRGGLHAYYAHNGEKSIVGLVSGVDIKGKGGLVILPGSRNPKTGASCQWLRGGPADFAKLPAVKLGSLPLAQSMRGAAARIGNEEEIIPIGERNKTLWTHAMQRARQVDSLSHLRLELEIEAERCAAPIAGVELDRIAASAWRYQIEGRNWIGGEARVQLTRTAFNDLAEDRDALTLYLF